MPSTKKLFLVFLVVGGAILVGRTLLPEKFVQLTARVLATTCQQKSACYFIQFRRLAYSGALEQALSILSEVQKIDPTTKQCHLLAHAIGYGVYDRDPETWRDLLGSLSHSGCREGVVHGLLERAIGARGGGALNASVIADICGSPAAIWCAHAMGHAILIDKKGDRDEALSGCLVFGRSSVFYCTEGVFMENATGFGLVSHGIKPESWLDWGKRTEELVKLCNSYTGSLQVACWEELAHGALELSHNSLPAVYRFCQQARDPDAAWMCQGHATGILLISLEALSLAKQKQYCDTPTWNTQEEERTCYDVLLVTHLYDHPERLDEAISFCNSLGEQFVSSCFRTMGAMVARSDAGKSKAKESCTLAPAQWQKVCSGIGSAPRKLPWEKQ